MEVTEQWASEVLQGLRSGSLKPTADLRTAAYNQLSQCTQVWRSVPPAPLVELIGTLLNKGVERARNAPRNQAMYEKAVRFVADHPDATVSAVRKAVGAPNQHTVDRWMDDADFKTMVRIQRGHKRLTGGWL